MPGRTDSAGAAYAGSQLQTQLYVNRRPGDLNAGLANALPDLAGADIEWRSPLADDGYAEYMDAAFLSRVDLGDHSDALRQFWPKSGPRWDALAVVQVQGDDRPGVVLAEGKSYPEEMYGLGCTATPASRAQIESALERTQQQLGVQGKTAADWCGALYQSANRLAHLTWLNSVGIRAWLVHLLFVDDPHRATTADEWQSALADVDAELGMTDVAIPNAAHVLLPAGTYEELVQTAT